MAASTSITALPLFYTTSLSTSATEIWAGPSTAQRGIVTACYTINRSSASASATVTHRMTSSGADIDLLPNTSIDANSDVIVGPVVLSSTTSQQSIRGSAGTASAIQVVGYGYLETI